MRGQIHRGTVPLTVLFGRTQSRSLRPTSSSTVCTPSFAMYSRSSCAINRMKFTTYSGLPRNLLRSSGFWCGNTDRTRIQVADSHHDASHRYKRRSRKAKFFCTQQCRNRYITTTHQLTVRLNPYFVSQAIHNQRLMCLCQSKFPGKSRIVDRTHRVPHRCLRHIRRSG